MLRCLSLLAAFGVTASLLAGCSSKAPPPCPSVFVLGDADKLTQFKPGAGRDITDVDFTAEFQGYKGECGYDAGEGSKLTFYVSFSVARGPANTTRKANFQYFVAVPYFYPNPAAKAIFPVTVEFPEGNSYVRHDDQPVSLTIPVAPGDDLHKYEVYIGFQETQEQLDYNRESKQRR